MITARNSIEDCEEVNWVYHKVFSNFVADVASLGKLVTGLKGLEPNSVRT
jgi:hypothetical protein